MRNQPVVYYRLGELTGTTAKDSSGNGHDGTLSGGVTVAQAGLIKGDPNGSMLFDGTSGLINLPTTGLPTGANPWTLEAWVKMPGTLPVSGSGFNGVVSIGTNVSKQIAWMYYRTTSQKFRLDTADNTINFTGVAVGNGIYHLVGTYDGVTVTFYVNGVAQGTYADTLSITYGTAQIGDDNGGDLWSGIIDEAAIDTKALTANQVTVNYQAGIASNVVRTQHCAFARMA